MADGFGVPGVEIVGPEPVFADRGEHLDGKLGVPLAAAIVLAAAIRGNAGGHGRVEGSVRAAPVHEFPDRLAGEQVRPRIEGVGHFPEFVHHVAPPLGAFAVRAVHVGVPHGDIKGAGRLGPEGVEVGIVAAEGAGEGGVVAGLAELERADLHAGGNPVVNLVAVHPAEALEALDAIAGDVFRMHVRLAATHEVVGADVDHESGGSLDLHPRMDLRVVGKPAFDQPVLLADFGVVLQPVVLPLRDGARNEGPPGRRPGPSTGHRSRPCGGIEAVLRPCRLVAAGVEGQARFRQAAVRGGVLGSGDRRVGRHPPGGVADQPPAGEIHREVQPGRTGAVVGEAVLPEMPDEHREGILPLPEPGGEVDLVPVDRSGSRSPLEASLEHGEPAVHPQPVFRIRGDEGGCLGRNLPEFEGAVEAGPLVDLRGSGTDPPCFRRLLRRCGRAPSRHRDGGEKADPPRGMAACRG